MWNAKSGKIYAQSQNKNYNNKSNGFCLSKKRTYSEHSFRLLNEQEVSLKVFF